MHTKYQLHLATLGLLAACGTSAEDPTPDETEGTQEETTTLGNDDQSSGTEGTTADASDDSDDSDDSDGTSDTGEPTDDTGDPDDTPFTVEFITEGFSNPESAHFHASTSTWFVSNIAGESGAPDGIGWISHLDRDGQILAEQWVAGLDSPAGITSDDTHIYVSDINRIHVFEIETALEVDTLVIETAAFLNDPAFGPDGTLYVSDSFAQAIYALAPGQAPSIVVQDEVLDFPNGVLWREDRLLIGSIGPFMDFEVDGPLHWLDVETGELELVRGVSAKFDGLVNGDDGVWMTDFRGSLMLWQDGELTVHDLVEHGMSSSADLGYDEEQRTLVIPDLLGSQVAFVQLSD